MQQELKPCPFCGEQCAELVINQGDKWGHYEPGCLEVRTSYETSENAPWIKDAAERWNTRSDGIRQHKWKKYVTWIACEKCGVWKDNRYLGQPCIDTRAATVTQSDEGFVTDEQILIDRQVAQWSRDMAELAEKIYRCTQERATPHPQSARVDNPDYCACGNKVGVSACVECCKKLFSGSAQGGDAYVRHAYQLLSDYTGDDADVINAHGLLATALSMQTPSALPQKEIPNG